MRFYDTFNSPPLAKLGRRPILRACEDRGWEHECAHIAEERAQLLVDHERVPRGSGGRGEDHRPRDEQVVVRGDRRTT
jgi:hypothetical protein